MSHMQYLMVMDAYVVGKQQGEVLGKSWKKRGKELQRENVTNDGRMMDRVRETGGERKIRNSENERREGRKIKSERREGRKMG